MLAKQPILTGLLVASTLLATGCGESEQPSRGTAPAAVVRHTVGEVGSGKPLASTIAEFDAEPIGPFRLPPIGPEIERCPASESPVAGRETTPNAGGGVAPATLPPSPRPSASREWLASE